MKKLQAAETIVKQIMNLDQNAMNRWQVLNLSAGNRKISLIDLSGNKTADNIYTDFGPKGWIKMEVFKPGYRLFIGLNENELYDLILVHAPEDRDVLLTFALIEKAEGICSGHLTEVIDVMTEKAKAKLNLI